jgi:DNA-binding ferritin-like protein (Dps family)
MAMKWIEAVTGPLEQKRQYRQDKARIETLPEPYGTAARAMHRYLINTSGIVDGDVIIRMLADLADLWEAASVDGTPVRSIVGDDPVDFADTFAKAYAAKEWQDKERARFAKAIEHAEKGAGS